MKLASLKHGRDGRLVVVSEDLNWFTDAFLIAPTLQAALDNLLRNAVRFSPPNGIIQVALTATGQGAQIIIDDQGPGVPDEWLSRLSEPFVRVPGQSADSGYGLGLTIAQRAVARHGGQLTFARNSDGGLRATVLLPGSRTGA